MLLQYVEMNVERMKRIVIGVLGSEDGQEPAETGATGCRAG